MTLLRLPNNSLLFALKCNIVFWLIPFALVFDVGFNLRYYAPDPQADSIGAFAGMVLIPSFLLWHLMNMVLYFTRKNYPSGSSVFVWNRRHPIWSSAWTFVCASYVAYYTDLWLSTVLLDLEVGTSHYGLLISLPILVLYSLYARAYFVGRYNG